MIEFVSEKLENFVGNGENVGYQPFFLFPTIFSKLFKSQHCVLKGESH